MKKRVSILESVFTAIKSLDGGDRKAIVKELKLRGVKGTPDSALSVLLKRKLLVRRGDDYEISPTATTGVKFAPGRVYRRRKNKVQSIAQAETLTQQVQGDHVESLINDIEQATVLLRFWKTLEKVGVPRMNMILAGVENLN